MVHFLFLLYHYYLCLSCKFDTKIIPRQQNTEHFDTYAGVSLVYPPRLLHKYVDTTICDFGHLLLLLAILKARSFNDRLYYSG